MRIQNRQDWEKVRAGGKMRFVVTRGVLGRGVPMGVVCALGIEVYLGGSFPDLLTSPIFLSRLLLASAVFSVGGCLNANMSWNFHERRSAVDH